MKTLISIALAVFAMFLLVKFAFWGLVAIACLVLLVSPLMTSGKGDRDYHRD